MTRRREPPVECLPNEEWRGVVRLEELYLISSYGRLFSQIHHRLLQPTHGRRVVLAGGRPRAVGELVLEAHGEQPQPAPGWIAWAEDRSIEWPYRLSNVRWIDRAELLAILRAVRSSRPRP